MTATAAFGNGALNRTISQWGLEYLASHGYALQSNILETVQNTPWSYVGRFATHNGYIYLKHTPELLALEAPITQLLRSRFPDTVPEVIAHNPQLHCFLMQDAGKPLRAILKKQFDTSLFCKAIDQFTLIQLAVADSIDTFLDLGVPDWRLDKLPALYLQLLAQPDILIADGLSATEITTLQSLHPKVATLCGQLSGYAIQQTLVQCDFHDNNVLIDAKLQHLTFIDLGEIVISHPFFSLIGCLQQATIHHALMEEDEAYLQLMDAGLKNYRQCESEENLLAAFNIARLLWFIYESLAQDRLRAACEKESFMSFQRHGKLSGRLKEFMTACAAQS